MESLDLLPWELIGEIAKNYDGKTLLSICTASKKYNKLCKDVRVWRNIFLQEGLDTEGLEPGLLVEDYIDLYWSDKNLHIDADIILENLRAGKYYDKSTFVDSEEQKWGIAFSVKDVLDSETFNLEDISDIVYGKVHKPQVNIFLSNIQRLENMYEEEILDQIQLQYDEDSKRFFVHYDSDELPDNKLYISDDGIHDLLYNLLKNNILLYDVMGLNIMDEINQIYKKI